MAGPILHIGYSLPHQPSSLQREQNTSQSRLRKMRPKVKLVQRRRARALEREKHIDAAFERTDGLDLAGLHQCLGVRGRILATFHQEKSSTILVPRVSVCTYDCQSRTRGEGTRS